MTAGAAAPGSCRSRNSRPKSGPPPGTGSPGRQTVRPGRTRTGRREASVPSPERSPQSSRLGRESHPRRSRRVPLESVRIPSRPADPPGCAGAGSRCAGSGCVFPPFHRHKPGSVPRRPKGGGREALQGIPFFDGGPQISFKDPGGLLVGQYRFCFVCLFVMSFLMNRNNHLLLPLRRRVRVQRPSGHCVYTDSCTSDHLHFCFRRHACVTPSYHSNPFVAIYPIRTGGPLGLPVFFYALF